MKSGYDQFFIKAKENATQVVDTHASQRSDAHASQRARYSEMINKKRELKNRNKKSFPVLPIFSFIFCVVFVFVLIEKFDSIETYISKIEIGLGAAQAEPAPSHETKAVTPLLEAAKQEDSTDYLFKLAERKKELDVREEELNKKSAEVAKQKLEIESKLKFLDDSRDKISLMLKERISADGQKVDNLVQVYSNMKASQAAKIFETMDEDLVIEILSRMKKKNAAEILNLVKTDKAQLFSERYAGYRKPAQSAEQSPTPGTSTEEDKNDLKAKP